MAARLETWTKTRPIWGALALLLASVPCAAQQDLWGQAILSYQTYGLDEAVSSGFNQQYNLRWDRQVSEPFHVQLFARAEANNATLETGDERAKNTYRQIQPSARIDYILPKLRLSGTYDLFTTKSAYRDTEGTRKLQRTTEFFGWTPDTFPFVGLQGEQRAYSDSLGGRDYREGFLTETLGWTWKGLSLTQLARYTSYDTSALDFSRKSYELQGLVDYNRSFFGGGLTVAANANFGKTRIDETASATTTESAPSRILIPVATYALDDTPLESRDHPLVPLPVLIDGNLSRGVGIDLGPSGTSYQNIGIDMLRHVALDTFRIHVRDAEEKLVPYGGLVRFDLYTSGDGIAWVPSAGARTVYLPAQGCYEMTFQSVTSRHFKVVSFGTNATDTLVTEIEAYFHTAYPPQTTRTTDTRFANGIVTLSGKPAAWLNLTYYANFSDYDYQRNNLPSTSTDELDQIVSAELIPSKVLDVTARYESRRVSAEGYRQSYTGLWGIATATFNSNLVATLEASRTHDQNLTDVVTDTLRAHTYTRFLPSVDLSLDVGVARGRYASGLLSTDQSFLNAVSYIQLTDSLKLTLTANFQRTTYEGDLTGLIGLPPQRYNRWYGELYWKPNAQLIVWLRAGYTTGSLEPAVLRALRVQWYPFARGTVGIGTVLDEDVESNGTFQRFRRVQILPTWMINKHATLSVNYNLLSLQRDFPAAGISQRSSTRLLYVNLTLTL